MMHKIKSEKLGDAGLFRRSLVLLAVVISLTGTPVFAQTNSSAVISTNVPGWITRPLSIVDALNLTLQQNSTEEGAGGFGIVTWPGHSDPGGSAADGGGDREMPRAAISR